MRNDKHLAIRLRKRGNSYNSISKELDIPKSTLSKWFSDIDWSRNIKKELSRKANYIAGKRLRLLNKAREQKWAEWREEARRQARDVFPILKQNLLFIAGIMIYWGEGDSNIKNSLVRLSNTNPDMLRIFSLFLREICSIPKARIKLTMILYPDLNTNKCKHFWSSIIGLPQDQFYKTQVIYGKHPTKRLSYGICSMTVASRQLKEKIFIWIDLFQRQYS